MSQVSSKHLCCAAFFIERREGHICKDMGSGGSLVAASTIVVNADVDIVFFREFSAGFDIPASVDVGE